MGCSKTNSKRDVYSNTILPQETRKTLNRQPTLHLENWKKKKGKKPKLIEEKKS